MQNKSLYLHSKPQNYELWLKYFNIRVTIKLNCLMNDGLCLLPSATFFTWKQDGENPCNRERVLWGILGNWGCKRGEGVLESGRRRRGGLKGHNRGFYLYLTHWVLGGRQCVWLCRRGLRGQLTHPRPPSSPFAPWEISGIERAGTSIWSLNLISLKLRNLLVLKKKI